MCNINKVDKWFSRVLRRTGVVVSIVVFFGAALQALAAVPTARDATRFFGRAAGYAGFVPVVTSPEVVIGRIVQGFIAFIGVIFGLFVIYGGYLWMTARGNEEQVKKSQGILRDSIIGFIIVIGAYALSSYVVGRYAGLVLR